MFNSSIYIIAQTWSKFRVSFASLLIDDAASTTNASADGASFLPSIAASWPNDVVAAAELLSLSLVISSFVVDINDDCAAASSVDLAGAVAAPIKASSTLTGTADCCWWCWSSSVEYIARGFLLLERESSRSCLYVVLYIECDRSTNIVFTMRFTYMLTIN